MQQTRKVCNKQVIYEYFIWFSGKYKITSINVLRVTSLFLCSSELNRPRLPNRRGAANIKKIREILKFTEYEWFFDNWCCWHSSTNLCQLHQYIGGTDMGYPICAKVGVSRHFLLSNQAMCSFVHCVPTLLKFYEVAQNIFKGPITWNERNLQKTPHLTL